MDNKPGKFLKGVKESMSPKKPDIGPRGKKGPGVLGGQDSSGEKGSSAANPQNGAAGGLGAAEAAAGQGLSTQNGDINESENNPDQPGLYTGSGKDENGKSKGKGGKGKAKKGPIATLIGIFALICTVNVASQVTMPFSILSQFRETLDSIQTSNKKRTKTMWAKQLENQSVTDPVKKKWLGFAGDTFSVHKNQKAKLEQQGIYLEDVDVNGKKKTVMLFDDGSNELKIVTPGKTSDFDGIDVSDIDLKKFKVSDDAPDFTIDPSKRMSFSDMFETSKDFRNGYIVSSRTWRGSVGAWFGKTTSAFLKSNKLTRNRFKNFQNKVDEEGEGNTRAAKKKAVAEMMEAEDEEVGAKYKKYTEEAETDEDGNTLVDEDGNPIVSAKSEETSTSFKAKSSKVSEIRAKLNEIADSKGGEASGVVSGATDFICSVADFMGTVSLLATAAESLQLLQIASGYFEGIDKVKAGDGDSSPVHVLSETLTEPAPTVNVVEGEDGEAKDEVIKGKEHTSAMQSAGMKAIYTNTKVDKDDPSVKNFNIGSGFKGLLASLGASTTSFMVCTVARLAASLTSAALDAVSLISCAATFGIGCVATAVWDSVGGIALSLGAQAVMSQAVEAVMPVVLKWLTRELVSNLAGEDLGNAITSGSNIYMGNNHLQGGGSLASQSKYTQFAMEQQATLAENARFERETLSPFDATSPYTFAGTLLRQFAVVQVADTPIVSTISSIGQVISNSATALLPSASAYDVEKNLTPIDEYAETCPWLASIGAVGDEFCNPYMVTDTSTIEEDPFDVVEQITEDDDGILEPGEGIDKETGEVIEGSNLQHYLDFCNKRESAFGLADGNIAGSFTASTGSTVGDTLVGAIPVIGDLVDAFGNEQQLENMGWITGESCVAKEPGDPNDPNGGVVTHGVSWSENKNYQRFSEDQRYFEGIDSGYTSPITAYYEKKERENPTDNSYEGILARKSGLTKEQVTDTLAVIDYYNYIADYDPETRYDFTHADENATDPTPHFDDNDIVDTPVNSVAILLNQTVFADLRGRSYAV